MPDPLLTTTTFSDAFRRAARVVELIGARLSRDGEQVFLEYVDSQNGAKLARIDCAGYPHRPPGVWFLDPLVADRRNAPPSSKRSHWPTKPPPIERNGSLHLCIAGTQSYMLLHGDPGHVIDLSSLVMALVWACKEELKRPVSALRR